MELTPVQTLAGWIVYCQRSGETGPMFPPRETLLEIVKRKAGRYEEAEAMAVHFLKKVATSAPEGMAETGAAAVRFVQGLDKMFGGMLGTPPVRPQGAVGGNGGGK